MCICVCICVCAGVCVCVHVHACLCTCVSVHARCHVVQSGVFYHVANTDTEFTQCISYAYYFLICSWIWQQTLHAATHSFTVWQAYHITINIHHTWYTITHAAIAIRLDYMTNTLRPGSDAICYNMPLITHYNNKVMLLRLGICSYTGSSYVTQGCPGFWIVILYMI